MDTPIAVPAITVGQLSVALGGGLGTSRSSILRAIASGRLPEPTIRDARGWRRWPVDVARRIVAATGQPVPQAWATDAA